MKTNLLVSAAPETLMAGEAWLESSPEKMLKFAERRNFLSSTLRRRLLPGVDGLELGRKEGYESNIYGTMYRPIRFQEHYITSSAITGGHPRA